MKNRLKKLNFSRSERALWLGSSALIAASYFLFDRQSPLTLGASLVGVTSLLFNAKGNPIGQVLMIAFSLLYGVISRANAYYGEMLTYLGMTAPMAAVALVTWLRHPHGADRSQVQVRAIQKRDVWILTLLTAAVTAAFYPLLAALGTANLVPSTVSVATSFAAAYLTYLRSPYFALAYAANDVVLIVLWLMAAAADASCLSVAVCFAAFLVNDCYGYVSWRRMHRVQTAA